MAKIKTGHFKAKDDKAFLIRHAVENDARELIEKITEDIDDGDGQIAVPGEFQMTEEKEREWIKSFLSDPNQLLILAEAEAEGKIVGVLDFSIGRRQRTHHAGMFGVSISKVWRQQGVGTALMNTLITWAKSNPQIEKISLRVLSDNPRAIGLYKKLGFHQEGCILKEIKYSDTKYADEIQMALFLR